jgi:hypothetical protein
MSDDQRHDIAWAWSGVAFSQESCRPAKALIACGAPEWADETADACGNQLGLVNVPITVRTAPASPRGGVTALHHTIIGDM